MAYASVKDDVETAARSAASTVADKASDMAAKAGSKVEQALEGAESAVNSVAETGRDAGQRVQEVAGNLKTAVDRSVKDQPMATLAVAAAMGFVIGALWKS
ncbi:MAG: DUF883 family protein [Hyphomicrobium sp.]|nr:DUF883 family protein [Hyphomicrobium sp.]